MGKYSGTCVSTAPVAEPTVMSFTVPSTGSTIDATAAVVTTCSASAHCTDPATPMCSGGVCVAMSCDGGSFTPDGAYDSLWDSVKPMTGKYTINYFQYQEDVGRMCMLNDWISSNDEICADNYNYFRFKLKGKGRSEQWEVYLYGDKTIKVDRDSAEVLTRGVLPPGIGGVGFGPSPNLATDHTIYELCLPSERGMGMSINLADPVSSGKYSGTCVSAAPVAEPTVVSFTVPSKGSTIVATATTVTSSSADCTDSASAMCSEGACVVVSCGGGSFTPDGAYDSFWYGVRAMTGKYTINYFQYQEDVGCVCMLNDWISSNDEICPDNYNYFRFKLKGKGRSEKWEVYLYGDKTIKVERDSAEVLPRGVPPPGIGGVGFGPSPNLATDHTVYELCLPSERGMGMSMNLADPVSSGKYSGTCVSTAPVVEPTVVSFTVPLS